jgi:parvulin-like peptidyl-prolyl isomerase
MRKSMKAIIIVVCVAFVATLLYTGFGIPQGPAGPPSVVAKVNGQKITREEFNNMLTNYLRQQEQNGVNVSADQRLKLENDVLDSLIEYNLIVQEAKRQHFKVSRAELDKQYNKIVKQFPDKDAFRQQLKQMGLSERKFRALLEEDQVYTKFGEKVRKVKVSAKDIADAYTQVRARHILIKAEAGKEKAAEADAKAVLAKVKAGEDFAALAKKYSQDPGTKDKGGDLGFFGQGQMVPEFEKAAFALKKNEVSNLVKSDYGYHIIQVVDRKEAKGKDFAKQKADLEKQVKEKKGQEAYQQLVSDLKAKAKLEIKDQSIEAYRLWQSGKLKEAIAKYQETIKEYAASSQLPYLHYGLAQVYKQNKQPAKELEHLKEAVKYNAGDASLELSLATALKEQKKEKEALTHFAKAGEIWPRDWQTHMTLYNTYQQLKLADKAKAEEKVLMSIQQEYMERQKAAQEATEKAKTEEKAKEKTQKSETKKK